MARPRSRATLLILAVVAYFGVAAYLFIFPDQIWLRIVGVALVAALGPILLALNRALRRGQEPPSDQH